MGAALIVEVNNNTAYAALLRRVREDPELRERRNGVCTRHIQ